MEILRINDIEFHGNYHSLVKVYNLSRLYNVHHISRHYNLSDKIEDGRQTTDG